MFKFALRNVLRNKKRSIITAIAVLIGAMVGTLALGWVNGMMDMMMNNYVKFQTANMKIVTPEFHEHEKFMPVDEYFEGVSETTKKIKAIDKVTMVEERIRFGIMLSRNEITETAIGMGIDLKNNQINIKRKLIAGGIEESGIYIGAGLAKKLGIPTNENCKSVSLLLATKTSEGGLNGIKLPVKGVFKYNIGMYDNQMFYIGLADAKKLLKLHPDATTELYVFTEKMDDTIAVQEAVKKILPKETIVLNYKQQFAMLELYEIMRKIYGFVSALIVFLGSFVVINTMMMNIFERMHEIGTLKAMGMTDRSLFFNFTLEGGIIGAVGGIFGALAGFGIIVTMAKVGMDFSEAFGGIEMPVDPIIRPDVSIGTLIMAIIISIVVPAMAAMIPARVVRKITPSEALRK